METLEPPIEMSSNDLASILKKGKWVARRISKSPNVVDSLVIDVNAENKDLVFTLQHYGKPLVISPIVESNKFLVSNHGEAYFVACYMDIYGATTLGGYVFTRDTEEE